MKKQNQSTEKLERLDELYPHVKIFMNVFYELVSIQGFLLPILENDIKLLKREFSQTDKFLFERIVQRMTEIRKINERMNESFFDGLIGESFDVMHENANTITRFVLLILDRVAIDKDKRQWLEKTLREMPSNGFITDEILNKFYLK